MIEENNSFDRFLFYDEKEIHMTDIEYCVDRILMFPKIRPHQLEKAIALAYQYCKKSDFRRIILENINQCPVLIYRLYKRGVFVFEEIEPCLRFDNSFLLCYYFMEEIEDFQSFIQRKNRPFDFDESFFRNTNDINHLIQYGFLPQSLEYCLKYDVIDELVGFNIMNQKAKWSPFEWSMKQKSLDLLAFSGFFGSIKCFKHLLLKGFEIDGNARSMVVCSGCLDLLHLCQVQQFLTSECVCKASEFFHLPILVYFFENGSDINAKDKDVVFLCSI